METIKNENHLQGSEETASSVLQKIDEKVRVLEAIAVAMAAIGYANAKEAQIFDLSRQNPLAHQGEIFLVLNNHVWEIKDSFNELSDKLYHEIKGIQK